MSDRRCNRRIKKGFLGPSPRSVEYSNSSLSCISEPTVYNQTECAPDSVLSVIAGSPSPSCSLIKGRPSSFMHYQELVATTQTTDHRLMGVDIMCLDERPQITVRHESISSPPFPTLLRTVSAFHNDSSIPFGAPVTLSDDSKDCSRWCDLYFACFQKRVNYLDSSFNFRPSDNRAGRT